MTIDRLPPSESGKFKQIVQKINRKLFREHACFSKCMHCELKINNRKNPGITTYIKKDCAKTNMCTSFADDWTIQLILKTTRNNDRLLRSVGNCSIKLNIVSGTLITYTHPVLGPFSLQTSSCHLNYQLKGENKFIR